MQGAAVSQRRLRTRAGTTSWAGGFVPTVGAMIAPLWAAAADRSSAADGAHKKVQLKPADPLVPTVRVAHALKWIIVFMTRQRGSLRRSFDVGRHKSRACVRMDVDASPWGLGGVLFWQGWPVAWFAEPITAEDIERFSLVIGSPKGQAVLEALAALVAVRLWMPMWKDDRLTMRLRSDSMAALGAMEKERSSDPRVNAIIREMSLDMAEGKYKVDVLEHLPGRANVLAYALR